MDKLVQDILNGVQTIIQEAAAHPGSGIKVEAGTVRQSGETLADIMKRKITGEPLTAFASPPKPETVKKAKAPRIRIDNTEAIADAGVKIIHFSYGKEGGMTVAYRQNGRKSRTIEIATAVTHPKDTFTKKIGTRLAVERFEAGETVFIPNFEGNAFQTIQYMFGD